MKFENTLDSILVKIGDFGKHQIYVFSIVCLSVILHSAVHLAYVYTALDVTYRCSIPECDIQHPEYEPSWLPNAVPYKQSDPSKCNRYFYNNTETNNGTCSLDKFDKSEVMRCSAFVYKTQEKSIVQEYNLQCEENSWKLSMVGSVNNFGQFVGLFFGGIIADEYGRRVVLTLGMVFCGICGVIRTFMPTYEWFLVFEFLDALFGSGTYICGFILGVELVSPKYRVLAGTLICICYPIGEVITGGIAWLLQSWKPLLYVLCTPSILCLSYFWLIPDSVRWYISKGKLEEAKKTLKAAAKYNGKEINDTDLNKLSQLESDETSKESILTALKSFTLLFRTINCCFCWITCAFIFYGLTLNSVALAAGNSYLDFILTSLVEIPAYVICNFVLDVIGRRKSLSLSFFITGVSCLSFIFIPEDSHYGSLSVYLLGKFGATAAFTIIYVITSEIFPTNLRQSFMGICSTLGRIGSMTAPQTPLLAQIWAPLPIISFTVMSFLAGFLSLSFPETTNIILPDTIEEAENLSKCAKKVTDKS